MREIPTCFGATIIDPFSWVEKTDRSSPPLFLKKGRVFKNLPFLKKASFRISEERSFGFKARVWFRGWVFLDFQEFFSEKTCVERDFML
jgi:hypothetical protein